MKRLALITISITLLLSLSSCISLGSRYVYDIELKKPKTKGNSYIDENISIFFIIGEKSIAFEIKNLSKEAIKIIWDEASIIIDNNSERVMHTGIRYLERDRPQTPTTIPPKTKITDSITPINNIYFQTGEYGGWRTNDLFLLNDFNKEEYKELILSQKGKKFKVYLPIKKGEKYIGYTFTFYIKDVSLLNEKDSY